MTGRYEEAAPLLEHCSTVEMNESQRRRMEGLVERVDQKR